MIPLYGSEEKAYNPWPVYQQGLEARQEAINAPYKTQALQAGAQDAKTTAAMNRLTAVGGLLNNVKDQKTYTMALQTLQNAGVELPHDTPQEYDPDYVDMYKNSVANTKAKIEQQYKLAEIQQMKNGGATGTLLNRLRDEPGLNDVMFNKTNTNKGMRINPVTGQAEIVPGYNESTASTAGSGRAAEKAAELEVAKQANKTKAESALKGFEQQASLVDNNINKALDTIKESENMFGNTATGYGAMMGGLPNTNARKLNNYLNTIKANVGFDELQNMRDNSPTGGALGQVSDMENRLLQAVNGALDPGQKDQLIENLNVIKTLYPQVLQEKKRAFEQDYGNVQPLGNNPVPDKINKATEPSLDAKKVNAEQVSKLSTKDPRVKQALDAGYSPDEIAEYLMRGK